MSDQNPLDTIDACFSPLRNAGHGDLANELVGARVTIEWILGAVRKLTTCEHIALGDLVYTVREREGLGWDGPASRHPIAGRISRPSAWRFPAPSA